jgi:hypothetical protein
LEKLEEMDEYLMHISSKINQKDINYLNQSIRSNEIVVTIKSLPKRKAPDLLLNSAKPLKNQYQHFQLFHEIGREGMLTHSFYEGSVTFTLNQKRTQ